MLCAHKQRLKHLNLYRLFLEHDRGMFERVRDRDEECTKNGFIRMRARTHSCALCINTIIVYKLKEIIIRNSLPLCELQFNKTATNTLHTFMHIQYAYYI